MSYPVRQDLTVPRDSDYGFTVNITDENEDPVPDVELVCAVRLKPHTPVVATFAVAEPSTGVFSVTLTRAESRKLNPKLNYYYDVAYRIGTAVSRPVYGYIRLIEDCSPTP